MKDGLPRFLLYALGWAWFWWAQILFGLWPQQLVLIPSSLGGLSPILSVWFIDRSKGEENLKAILGSVRRWREVPLLLLGAAFLFPLLNITSKLIGYLLGAPLMLLAQGRAELGLFLVFIIPVTFITGLVSSPLFEEPAWRGYTYPRLAERYGVNVASLLLGSYWWVWHLMMNLSFGLQPTLPHFLMMVGQSCVIDSLYLYSKRIILVAMFAHSSLFIMLTYLATVTGVTQTVYIMLLWASAITLRIYVLKKI